MMLKFSMSQAPEYGGWKWPDFWFPEKYVSKENKNGILGNTVIVVALRATLILTRRGINLSRVFVIKELGGHLLASFLVSEPKIGKAQMGRFGE